MTLLTKKPQQESCGNTKTCDTCNLKYSAPKNIFKAFNNGYKYDYHFIIKDLAKEF